ncbi:MAG: chromosome segregation protein SMC, partial [Colwellia sp.]|nr:chromosome segregation protein SMC [Colwellia sp.]
HQQLGYTKTLEQQSLLNAINQDNDNKEPLNDERYEIESDLVKQQSKIQKLNDERFKLVQKAEQAKNKKNQVDDQVIKINEQLNLLLKNKQKIKDRIQQTIKPLENDNKTLQTWLSEICLVDKKLSGINKEQSDASEKNKTLEQQKQHNIKESGRLTEQVNKQNLEIQNYNLRAEAALEQLKEMQQNVADVQFSMPKEIIEGVWQAHIMRIAKDIDRLGAINLAAISEYENQLSRRNYLELQNDDLSLSINTLESVIIKIDKESRQKFQTTFDKVNNDLKVLFPKVFGGGSAYLELTGDDLLDTGVTIMARPPGKKNSTIHLLSGGEKALTALSLVFAIFRLNPAPFCMLDEVDAPLDDANVERFCNLVREMSQTVQFIYISHNKIAMEMASHLTGVTMFEPGVSRMVAVDIDEAIAMAENT